MCRMRCFRCFSFNRTGDGYQVKLLLSYWRWGGSRKAGSLIIAGLRPPAFPAHRAVGKDFTEQPLVSVIWESVRKKGTSTAYRGRKSIFISMVQYVVKRPYFVPVWPSIFVSLRLSGH